MVKLYTKSSVISIKRAIVSYLFTSIYCCSFFFTQAQQEEKEWTCLVYMAANNDLAPFALKNFHQMQQVGSTPFINIIVNHNHFQKNEKYSDIYAIEKNSRTLLQSYNSSNSFADAGDPQTLVRFCKYAIAHYPAKHYLLIFWNHGTGILEPSTRNRTPYLQLFSFNSSIHGQKATKSNTHALPVALQHFSQKAVCFDDGSGNFLTERDIVSALQEICQNVLKKPFDIIGFDACLMAMIEIATSIQPFATYFIASQEVELGWGWNYELALKPFTRGTIKPKIFGIHLVNAYAKIYKSISDHSLSLIDLQHIETLKSNVSLVAQLSTKLLCCENKKAFKNIIHLSRNKHFCTHFDEPSFIDLAHFYQNFLLHSVHYAPPNTTLKIVWEQLLEAVKEGVSLVATCVLHNKTGKKATKAQGLSIYFPETALHYSYFDSSFAQSTAWLSFLNLYLQDD